MSMLVIYKGSTVFGVARLRFLFHNWEGGGEGGGGEAGGSGRVGDQ
jgi:hypothetical protein